MGFVIKMTIICTVLLIINEITIATEVKKHFTAEELKIIKNKKKKKYAWYIIVFSFCCPFVNLLFVIIEGINYRKIIDRIVQSNRKLIE